MRQHHTVDPLDQVVTTRPMTINGVPYAKGERVDTRTLSNTKVAQLLELRRLEPAPAHAGR